MILHVLLRLLARLGDRAQAAGEWLGRPLPRGQGIINALVALILILLVNHTFSVRSAARDQQTRDQDQAICLFASLFPRPTIPAVDLPKYDQAVALAHCSMFKR